MVMRIGFYRKYTDRVQTFENVVRASSINQGMKNACFVIKQFDKGELKTIQIPMNDARLTFVED